MFTNPLSPFKNTHRRAVSTPRTQQTQWPLIATSTPPSVAYPTSPHHDPRTCGANCIRCGKRKLIQLNSPPSANIPTSAAPLRPIPQAHMRAVSEGTVSKGPKRLSITTTPASLTPGKPPCCQKCGRHKRPASLPVLSSSQAVQFQMPSAQRSRPLHPMNYSTIRPRVLGTTSGTPHPNKRLPSRSPSPPSPDHFYSSTSAGNGEHIISPLSPRRKVDFAFPSKSSSGSSTMQYSPLSPSDETVEIGTGRLINLISNAIRESSPPQSAHSTPAAKTLIARANPPPTTNSSQAHAYTPLPNQSQSTTDNPTPPTSTSTSTTHLTNSRSPISLSTLPPFSIELDSVPIGSTTADILSGYSDDDEEDDTTTLTRTQPHPSNNDTTYPTEYNYDWTDALSIPPMPIIRLPSVKEGISRFKSLRGYQGGSGSGINRRPSVRERFGSLRRDNNTNSTSTNSMMQYYKQAGVVGGGGGGGWYGGMGSNTTGKYQALGSSVEVGIC
jgi:hypothetical protein